jgi:hypothetical protein
MYSREAWTLGSDVKGLILKMVATLLAEPPTSASINDIQSLGTMANAIDALQPVTGEITLLRAADLNLVRSGLWVRWTQLLAPTRHRADFTAPGHANLVEFRFRTFSFVVPRHNMPPAIAFSGLTG